MNKMNKIDYYEHLDADDFDYKEEANKYRQLYEENKLYKTNNLEKVKETLEKLKDMEGGGIIVKLVALGGKEYCNFILHNSFWNTAQKGLLEAFNATLKDQKDFLNWDIKRIEALINKDENLKTK